MLEDFITAQIRRELPFTANTGQEELLRKLGLFLTSTTPQQVFILRGYAGTGKTSVISALVRAMEHLKQKTCLLAPTGRAAKVIAAYSGFPAYTIHKRIYRQKQLGLEEYGLAPNMVPNTLFIVDEASMIANQQGEGTSFGSGRLLDDLVKFVYSAQGCRLLLLGDDAQLPPVGQNSSPALSADNMRAYGLNVSEHILTEVARQALDSGILKNATEIRRQLNEGNVNIMPEIETKGFCDIQSVDGNEAIELLERSYDEVGLEDTIILTRTNKRTNIYNAGVRNQILWKEDEISSGDRIMVSKNNYFWTEQYENLPFLANGDMFEILRIRNTREIYGFRFADASLKALDYDWEIDVTIWLDTLFTENPETNYHLQQKLFTEISQDYPEIKNKRDLVKKVMESPYYNALQIRFAYCVTCHKSQGGQWKRVFIDPGFVQDEQLGENFYRWFYTALTRAQEQVYLINFPPAVTQ